MDMDAATGDGDNIITELKYDELGTTYFNCNINLSRLICDIIFLTSPKRILPPSQFIQLVDAARQNCNCMTDSQVHWLSNDTRFAEFGLELIVLCPAAVAGHGFCVRPQHSAVQDTDGRFVPSTARPHFN